MLLGRLANGQEADHGRVVHAVTMRQMQRPACPFNEWGRRRANDTVAREVALCGAQPGRRSVGWSDGDEGTVTCPRCAARLAADRPTNGS